MVGVTNPGSAARKGHRLWSLASLSAGYAITTLFLVIALATVSEVMSALLTESVRRTSLIFILAALGLADLVGHTPQTQRQVPQRFVRDLSIVPRNFFWGLDLGLLFTSQKTTSLIWMAISAAILLGTSVALIAVPAVAAAGFLGAFAVGALSPPRTRVTSHFTNLGLAVSIPSYAQRSAGVIGLAVAGSLLLGIV